MSPARWHQLMRQWHAPASDSVFLELKSAYSEPHRHYHTEHHIDDCLTQLDEVSGLVRAPEEVELALWFHDAIYRPASSANESKSAEWVSRFLQSVGVVDARSERVRGYIMATKHTDETLRGDAAIVVDIDLSILGRPPHEYDAYEQAIREEYRWVPGPIYRRRRIQILESLVDRPAIYRSEHFRSLYEDKARDNLQRAIAGLRK